MSDFTLMSNGGTESLRCSSVGTMQGVAGSCLVCDVELVGVHYELWDQKRTLLCLTEVPIPVADLRQACSRLEAWATLPAAEQRLTPLIGAHALGKPLELDFGPRPGLRGDGRQTVTLRFRIGRFCGEFAYITDPSCIQDFCAGIRETLLEIPAL